MGLENTGAAGESFLEVSKAIRFDIKHREGSTSVPGIARSTKAFGGWQSCTVESGAGAPCAARQDRRSDLDSWILSHETKTYKHS